MSGHAVGGTPRSIARSIARNGTRCRLSFKGVMWTPFLKLWEALGEPLGILIVVLVISAAIWMWRQVVKRLDDFRKEFWAHMKEQREADEKRADRDRAAHEARADRDSERNARDIAWLTSAIATLQGDVSALQGNVRVLQGDVSALLDRSNRSSGDEAGRRQSSPHDEVVRQATPDQCEDDVKPSSDQPVAQPPVDSAAEDPAD